MNHDAEGIDAAAAKDDAQKAMLADVEAALDRIKDGDIGTCISCGHAIAEERMEAIPQTLFCVDCEEQHETE